MRWKHLTIAGALIGLLGAGYALAQSITQNDISGNECWQVGQGPGGPGSYLCVNLVRNSQSGIPTTLTGTNTFGVGSLAKLVNGGRVLITAQPGTGTTLIAPANPVADGTLAGFCNVTGSAFATTTIAMIANTGQTFNSTLSLNNLAAGTCLEVQFLRSTTTWYRVQ